MNGNYWQDREDQEEEIDLARLFSSVFKHWRQLIVFFIVGALIGCGISCFKMITSPMNNPERYFAKLEETDGKKINKEAVRIYADYKALYDATLENDNNSIIMNMDENNVWSARQNYFITCDSEQMNTVIAYYNSLMNQEENLQKILTASELNCTRNDIGNLVSIRAEKIGLDNQVVTVEDRIESRKANLGASVVAPDKECMERMMEQITHIIEDTNEEMTILFPSFSIEKNSEITTFGHNDRIAAQESEHISTRQKNLENITKIEETLSDEEKYYYEYTYNNAKFLENSKPSFSKKWPLICAFVFAILAGCWYAVRFILDKKIKSEDEIANTLAIPVLGSIDRTVYKTALDEYFDSWGRAGAAPSNSEEYLKTLLDSRKTASIALVYDVNDTDENTLAQYLAENCTKVRLAGNLAFDPSAIKIVESCEETVFLVHLDHTAKSVFVKNIETNHRLEKTTAGTIVIR